MDGAPFLLQHSVGAIEEIPWRNHILPRYDADAVGCVLAITWTRLALSN